MYSFIIEMLLYKYYLSWIIICNKELSTPPQMTKHTKRKGSLLYSYPGEEKHVEYQRLKQRVEFDLEMIEATGMCKGIENYSRLLTDKKEGETPYSTPYSLIDYFEAMDRPYLWDELQKI